MAASVLLLVGFQASPAAVAARESNAQSTLAEFMQWPLPPGLTDPAALVVHRLGTVAFFTTDNGRLVMLSPEALTPNATLTSWSLGDFGWLGGLDVSVDGQVFVRTSEAIQRIDPVTNRRTVWSDDRFGAPSDLSVGLDVDQASGASGIEEAVWSLLSSGELQRLVLTSSELTRWDVRAGVDFLLGVDVNPQNGRVYFSDTAGENIGELDPTTDVVRRWPLAAVGASDPKQLRVDSLGHVWVVAGSGHIVRLRPGTSDLTAYVPPEPGPIGGIAPDGVVGHTTAGAVGVLVPAGAPVSVAPTAQRVIWNQATAWGFSETVTPVAFPVLSAAPSLQPVFMTSNAGGVWFEAQLPPGSPAAGPIDRDPTASSALGAYFYATNSPTGGDRIGYVTFPPKA